MKLGKFHVEHKSQLELYLRWLDKYEKADGENTPLGVLLCAEKNDNLVEFARIRQSRNTYIIPHRITWQKGIKTAFAKIY